MSRKVKRKTGKARKVTKQTRKRIACTGCGSRNFVYHGYRYNISGKKRLRKCRNCGRKFTADDGFLRMRFGKKHIMKAVRMAGRGASLAEIKNELKTDGVNVSRWTISKWKRKFGKFLV